MTTSRLDGNVTAPQVGVQSAVREMATSRVDCLLDEIFKQACCLLNELICRFFPFRCERSEVSLGHLILPTIWESTGR